MDEITVTSLIDALRQHTDDEIRRIEGVIGAEAELRRARREDDLRAFDKADGTMSRRLEQMNEFRSQIQTERQEFVRRDFIDEQIKAGLMRWETTNGRISAIERIQFKIIGGLVLATFIAPLITGIVVYLLTRHAIPTEPTVTTPVP